MRHALDARCFIGIERIPQTVDHGIQSQHGKADRAVGREAADVAARARAGSAPFTRGKEATRFTLIAVRAASPTVRSRDAI